MATPGKSPIVMYSGASHDILFVFKDSAGADFDISAYTTFTLNFYKLNSLTVEESYALTRTGSELTKTLTVAQVQELPRNGRYELLFSDGTDVDPVLRDSLTVTDVRGDDSISTSASVEYSTKSVLFTATKPYQLNEPVVNHFSVQNVNTSGNSYIIGGNGDNGYLALYEFDNRVRPATVRVGGASVANGTTTNSLQHILYQYADRLSLKAYTNGTLEVDIADIDADFTNYTFFVGGWRNISPFAPTKNLQELILFTTDQSVNRTEIESNINNYYNVF